MQQQQQLVLVEGFTTVSTSTRIPQQWTRSTTFRSSFVLNSSTSSTTSFKDWTETAPSSTTENQQAQVGNLLSVQEPIVQPQQAQPQKQRKWDTRGRRPTDSSSSSQRYVLSNKFGLPFELLPRRSRGKTNPDDSNVESGISRVAIVTLFTILLSEISTGQSVSEQLSTFFS